MDEGKSFIIITLLFVVVLSSLSAINKNGAAELWKEKAVMWEERIEPYLSNCKKDKVTLVIYRDGTMTASCTDDAIHNTPDRRGQ